MANGSATRLLKAKIIAHPNHSNSNHWTVRLNPTNLDLSHPGNALWFLEFDQSALASAPVLPAKESDLERATFKLNADKTIKNCRQGKPCQPMTVAQFFASEAKYQPGAFNNDKRTDPNGNIGDPTSRSALC